MSIAALGLLLLAAFHQQLFFAFDDTIRVEENDAARFCRTYTPRLTGLLYPQDRSEVPKHGYLGYCGAILTDRGFYLLPEDKYPVRLDTARDVLDDALRPGCRFRVRIVGYGGKFRDRPVVPVRQRISRIIEPLGCAS